MDITLAFKDIMIITFGCTGHHFYHRPWLV